MKGARMATWGHNLHHCNLTKMCNLTLMQQHMQLHQGTKFNNQSSGDEGTSSFTHS